MYKPRTRFITKIITFLLQSFFLPRQCKTQTLTAKNIKKSNSKKQLYELQKA